MAKLYLTLLFALALLAHATARNIPTDQTTNPNPNAAKTAAENMATTSGVPAATDAIVGGQKNFISYGGMGGWGGVGYVGVLPIIGGIGVGGVGGAGGVGGLGGLGGLGKVGGIGVGGGVGGIIP